MFENDQLAMLGAGCDRLTHLADLDGVRLIAHLFQHYIAGPLGL